VVFKPFNASLVSHNFRFLRLMLSRLTLKFLDDLKLEKDMIGYDKYTLYNSCKKESIGAVRE